MIDLAFGLAFWVAFDWTPWLTSGSVFVLVIAIEMGWVFGLMFQSIVSGRLTCFR